MTVSRRHAPGLAARAGRIADPVAETSARRAVRHGVNAVSAPHFVPERRACSEPASD